MRHPERNYVEEASKFWSGGQRRKSGEQHNCWWKSGYRKEMKLAEGTEWLPEVCVRIIGRGTGQNEAPGPSSDHSTHTSWSGTTASALNTSSLRCSKTQQPEKIKSRGQRGVSGSTQGSRHLATTDG